MEEELLSNYLYKTLFAEHGSLSEWCRIKKISYGTFRKALQRNSFSIKFLTVIAEELGLSLEKISQSYKFNTKRFKYPLDAKFSTGQSVPPAVLGMALSELNDKCVLLIVKNPLIAHNVTKVIEEECTRILSLLESTE